MESEVKKRGLVGELRSVGRVLWDVIYSTVRYPTRDTIFKNGRIAGHFTHEELEQKYNEERKGSIERLTEDLMINIYDPVVNDPAKKDEFRDCLKKRLLDSDIIFPEPY